jgi:hypothetical protein
MMDQFISEFNGQRRDYNEEVLGAAHDTNTYAQCVDLVHFWMKRIGSPVIMGNAIDLQGNHDGYTWVKNTVTGVPKRGDIVVFSISKYGHTSIFNDGNTSSFNSFDQNYPTNSPCKMVNHNYDQVIGWLHPTVLDSTTVPTETVGDAIQFENDTKVYFWAQTQDVAKAWYGSDWGKWVRLIKPQTVTVEVKVPYEVDSAATIKKVGELTDQVSALSFENNKLDGAITGLNKEIADAYTDYRVKLDAKDLEIMRLKQYNEELSTNKPVIPVKRTLIELIIDWINSIKRKG